MRKSKEEIFKLAKRHLKSVIFAIEENRGELMETISKKKSRKGFVANRDRLIEEEVLKYNEKRVEELLELSKSPYFFRCRVKFDERENEEDVFISKFNFSDKQIYSWFSAISKLRFDEIGEFSYTLPNSGKRKGCILQKDQFMITNGKIVYMASEADTYERELIYQEHLSNRKKGFILPEILATMEKKQDEVIRADYRGSYLISGPAGSGKTTLALHRVAYLAQSPDTSEKFPGNNIILFVQDESTLEYFKSIFPQLGIDDVIITTFHKWALEILEINDYGYVYRYGNYEKEKDVFEFAKRSALKNHRFKNGKIEIDDLEEIYEEYFNPEQKKLFKKQIEEGKLDRFDLTFLLKSKIIADGPLGKMSRVIVERKNGDQYLKDKFMPLKYSLIIVDEVQNYMIEELEIIKGCINQNEAILYTGDLAQQTKLFTLKEWDQVGEDFKGEKKVVLDKVYRNTKEILKYIENKGYKVFIPNELKSGQPVSEKFFNHKEDEISFVKDVVKRNKNSIIGILNNDDSYLGDYKKYFSGYNNAHILTISESQGVEFDIVLLVGFEKEKSIEYKNLELLKEKMRVINDLNYVAMTRAMNELYICFK